MKTINTAVFWNSQKQIRRSVKLNKIISLKNLNFISHANYILSQSLIKYFFMQSENKLKTKKLIDKSIFFRYNVKIFILKIGGKQNV